MKRITCFLMVFLLGLTHSVRADETDNVEMVTVNLSQAGQLADILFDQEILSPQGLKIVGPIGGADIAYLKEGATGRFLSLKVLDLSEAVPTADSVSYPCPQESSASVIIRGAVCYISDIDTMLVKNSWNSMGQISSTYTYYTTCLRGAFAGMPCKKIVWPHAVSRVGNKAFYDCEQLQSVELHNGVTEIEERAFEGCEKLRSIQLPPGVTKLEAYTFFECESLRQIDLNHVTKLETYTFSGCDSLQQIDLSRVTSIGKGAFSKCVALKNIGSLDQLTELGEDAFSDCTNLVGNADTETLHLNNLSKIPMSAFRGCKSLKAVSFSKDLVSVGDMAFYECSSLAAISFPDGMEEIGAKAFYKCEELSTVNYPSTLRRVNANSFQSTPWYYLCGDENGVIYMGHIALGLKNMIDEEPISISIREGSTCIADGFGNTIGWKQYTEKCTSITLPSTLLRIGNGAFSSCFGSSSYWGTGITSLTIPEGVEEIGSYAFAGSKLLTSLNLPTGSTKLSIGSYAFQECEGLTSLTLPANVDSIGEYAFKGCTGFSSFTLPETLKFAGEGIFYNCKAMVLLKCYAELGPVDLFESYGTDNSLEKVVFGPHVRKLPVLSYCRKLRKVEFEPRLESDRLYVSPRAFYGCESLTAIELPVGTDSIGYQAFSADGSYGQRGALETVILPEGLKKIESSAFRLCDNMTSIEIPSTLTYIGRYALECAKLTTVTSRIEHPENVEAGDLCYSSSIYNKATLYVPYGTRATYESLSPWYEFGKIVEMEGPTSIDAITEDEAARKETGRYDLQGRFVGASEKGLRIIRYDDGTSRKVIVK